MAVENLVHCLYDRQFDSELLIGEMDGLGAIVALCDHLHFGLRGLDAISHANHLSELSVAREVGVGGNEHISEVSAIGDIALDRRFGLSKTHDLVHGIGEQDGLEIVAIAQTAAHARRDSVDILHDAGVLEPHDIVAGSDMHIFGSEQLAPEIGVVEIGAAQGEVAQSLESNLLSMTRTCYDAQILLGNTIVLVQIVRDKDVLVRDHTLDSRDDSLARDVDGDIIQTGFHIRRWYRQDDGVGQVEHLIDIRREIDLAGIEIRPLQMLGVATILDKLVDSLLLADEPMDLVHIVKHNLSQCGSPTARTEYCYIHKSLVVKAIQVVWWLFFGFHCREQEHLLDRRLACHEDSEAVDTDADTRGRRHAVF